MFLNKIKFIVIFIISIAFTSCASSEESEEVIEPPRIIDIDANPETNIDPNVPASKYDLSKWKISVPINRGDGIALDVSVEDINKGYDNKDYFYIDEDGGMVFKCFVEGPKTSVNTKFTRTELREMLRGTNTGISTKGVTRNNWVFGTAPENDINTSGGYDGLLEATLAVNYVTRTGSNSHVGRVIIGQIHANDNEPCRLYYRKLPNNEKGGIYFAHEPADGFGSEEYINIIGSRDNSALNPEDGISLDEKFSYTIEVVGDDLTVTILREGKDDVSQSLNMANSGYSSGGKYQYFKAGVYNQNNTGEEDDYVQATFYDLKQSHN